MSVHSSGHLRSALNACSSRWLHTSSAAQRGSAKASEGGGFFSSLFDRKVEAQVLPHANKFASKEIIIELQTHNVKPDCVGQYNELHRQLAALLDKNKDSLHCESLGNFSVFVGDEDQYVHLWRYDNGYSGIDKTLVALNENAEYQKLKRELAALLRSRHSQYLMPFGFWPELYFRSDSHIYELRSYHLKPGTLVEWGNYWARAISMRDYKHTEAYMGVFSQVGELYNVKHLWCYNDLEERKEARENVWQKQQSQWSEIVAQTTPLIRNMTSRIMTPLKHSPTQ